MAKRWVVLTADRTPHVEHEIITYTEWAGLLAAADEVIYTDPVDAVGNPVDDLWKVSGLVTRAGAGTPTDPYTYNYSDSSLEPSLVDRQRGQIYDAYLFWRVFGRTNHWEGIRAQRTNLLTQSTPLDATDLWAFHIVALVDQAIHGAFPITGAYSAEDLQAFIDHADNILRRLGPTWYLVQIETMNGNSLGEPTPKAVQYAGLNTAPGTIIYTDIVTVLGVLRIIDGEYLPVSTVIRDGFNPEMRSLGN